MKQIALAIAAMLIATTAAEAAGDAALGEKVFLRCRVCHNIGEGATNKIGPELNGIIGRKAASVEGYSYGDGLKTLAANGLVWDEASLTQYLHNPRAFNPGTKMAFAGIPKDADIANVIAYLSQFDADGKKK